MWYAIAVEHSAGGGNSQPGTANREQPTGPRLVFGPGFSPARAPDTLSGPSALPWERTERGEQNGAQLVVVCRAKN